MQWDKSDETESVSESKVQPQNIKTDVLIHHPKLLLRETLHFFIEGKETASATN